MAGNKSEPKVGVVLWVGTVRNAERCERNN
jgi:hypothetical protein